MKKIEDEGIVSVPKHLQDGNRDAAPTGQGKDYVYPHEFDGHFIPQQYLPDDCWALISTSHPAKDMKRRSFPASRCGGKLNAKHWGLNAAKFPRSIPGSNHQPEEDDKINDHHSAHSPRRK